MDGRTISFGRDAGRLCIAIDGQDLIELLRVHERPYAEAEGSPGLAGGYVGISIGHATAAHLLGTPAPGLDYEDRCVLLVCGDCTIEGCWDFVARVRELGGRVVWDRLAQTHREPGWGYDALEPLSFDARQYRGAIDSLRPNPA